jgi:hypothetical protein
LSNFKLDFVGINGKSDEMNSGSSFFSLTRTNNSVQNNLKSGSHFSNSSSSSYSPSSFLLPVLFWTYRRVNSYDSRDISHIYQNTIPKNIKITYFLSFLETHQFNLLKSDEKGSIIFPDKYVSTYSSLLSKSPPSIKYPNPSKLFSSSILFPSLKKNSQTQFEVNELNNNIIIPSFNTSINLIKKTKYNYLRSFVYSKSANLSFNQFKSGCKGFLL